MILNSIDKQLKLAEDGQITWQKDLTNPMPGEAVATIIKGASVLAPSCTLIDTPVLADQDKDVVLKFVQEWLVGYIKSALEPLFKLQDEDIAEGVPRDIAGKLFDALGILPREDLQSLIAQMDEEKRASLRSKKIRFGPLLVYLPELNKPAAVRLRALLLSLWQDKNLPAVVPVDGIVSFSITDKEIDKNYYRAIGYPVYGPRSIRVDMLDRVVCAVYDTAKDGKFMAQHQMAEWLGSNIADLYAVLEAMGHVKEHDPADDVKIEEEVVAKAETPVEEKQEKVAEPVVEGGIKSVVIDMEKPEQVKPDLATFRLKKGKAINAQQSNATSRKKNLGDKKFSSDKKKFKSKGKKPYDKKQTGQRVYKAEAETKPEDSPFAILGQLKTSNKD
jgi:ATP-dependent RNA helicase SUPV3L1/SUV3